MLDPKTEAWASELAASITEHLDACGYIDDDKENLSGAYEEIRRAILLDLAKGGAE